MFDLSSRLSVLLPPTLIQAVFCPLESVPSKYFPLCWETLLSSARTRFAYQSILHVAPSLPVPVEVKRDGLDVVAAPPVKRRRL